RPSRLISTQHGAVCPLGNGEPPIELSTPCGPSSNADTVPAPAPPWAFDTNTWSGLTGLNSLPNGPGPWAAKGDPGAACRPPRQSMVKLSICEVPTRVPTSLVAVELMRTSPGCAVSGRLNVAPGMGRSRPSRAHAKPV